MDARNFFDNQRAPFKQNIFGFTFGGPFYIPHRYNTDKSKTFFFVSEGWNKRQGPQIVNFTSPPQSTFTAQTVDLNQRQGIFTGLAAVKDPTTGAPFPSNHDSGESHRSECDDPAEPLLSAAESHQQSELRGHARRASRWHEDLFRVDQTLSRN